MKYKIRHRTYGEIESYIASTTFYIEAFLDDLYSEPELMPILQRLSYIVEEWAARKAKGLEFEINDGGTYSLIVRNTNGQKVLSVWFERVYDKGQAPQSRKL